MKTVYEVVYTGDDRLFVSVLSEPHRDQVLVTFGGNGGGKEIVVEWISTKELDYYRNGAKNRRRA